MLLGEMDVGNIVQGKTNYYYGKIMSLVGQQVEANMLMVKAHLRYKLKSGGVLFFLHFLCLNIPLALASELEKGYFR